MNQPEADARLGSAFRRLAKQSVMVILAVGEVPPSFTLTASFRPGGQCTIAGADLAVLVEALAGPPPPPRREEAVGEKELRRRRFEHQLQHYAARDARPQPT